jgi:hypothetical protein
MSTFRCSAGHQSALAFGGEEVSLPCPTCGVDVYKFRDAVLDDDGPPPAARDPRPTSRRFALSLDRREVRVAIVGVVLLAAAALTLKVLRPQPAAPSLSSAPVIPISAAAAPRAPNPEEVSITDFNAARTDADTVRVSFRLTNRGGTANGYPNLAVRWHGVPGGDQLIRNDAYAHPPLPFTTADVSLELARPGNATGIDVKILY